MRKVALAIPFVAVLALAGWMLAVVTAPGHAAGPACEQHGDHRNDCGDGDSKAHRTTTVVTVTRPVTSATAATTTVTQPVTTTTSVTVTRPVTTTTSFTVTQSVTATVSPPPHGETVRVAGPSAQQTLTVQRVTPTGAPRAPATATPKAKTRLVTLYKKKVVRVWSRKRHRYVKHVLYVKVHVRVLVAQQP